MPAPRKKQYRRRQKRYKKKKKNGPYMLVNRGPTFLPDIYRTKHKYVDRLVLNTVSGLVHRQVYRGNSMYDPDYTGAGHQPLGRDSIAALYGLYRVYGSSIKIRYMSTDTSAAGAQEIALLPSINASSLTSTDPQTLAENPRAKFMIASAVGDPSQQHLFHYMSTKQILGDSYMKGQTTAATDGTNPASEFFWIITTQTVDESTTAAAYLYVDIVYYVEWFGRKAQSES